MKWVLRIAAVIVVGVVVMVAYQINTSNTHAPAPAVHTSAQPGRDALGNSTEAYRNLKLQP